MISLFDRIRRHWGDPQSPHRRVASGFLWVGGFIFIAKLAGAMKEMAIAWRYGVSETVDAYAFAFNVLILPSSLCFSLLSLSLVPIVARLRRANPQALKSFQSELLGLTLLVGIALGLISFFAFPAMLRAGWISFSREALPKALEFAAPLSFLIPLGVTSALFSAWTLASGAHRNTLLEGVPSLALFFALLLPDEWTQQPLIWGTLVGVATQAGMLAAPFYRVGEMQAPAISFRSPVWRSFGSAILALATTQTVMSATTVVDQLFAAQLGPGALSTLGYANRILSLIISMISLTISRATLPVLAEIRAQGLETRHLVLRWTKWVLMLGFIALAIGWVAAPLAVKVIFERGRFGPNETIAVTDLLRFGLLQIPFYASAMVLQSHYTWVMAPQSGIFSLRGQYLYILATLGASLARIVVDFVTIPYIGARGIQLGAAAMLIVLTSSILLIIIYADGKRR